MPKELLSTRVVHRTLASAQTLKVLRDLPIRGLRSGLTHNQHRFQHLREPEVKFSGRTVTFV